MGRLRQLLVQRSTRLQVDTLYPINSLLPPAPQQTPLRHRVIDGPATCLLYRDHLVAAQVLLTNGVTPRLLTAFVAGNSGAALWFDELANSTKTAKAVQWREIGDVTAIEETDSKGRRLLGITIIVEANCAALCVRQALLGSVRVIRDHQFDGRLPAHGLGLVNATTRSGAVRWARDRLDGAAGYALDVQVEGGSVALSDQATRKVAYCYARRPAATGCVYD